MQEKLTPIANTLDELTNGSDARVAVTFETAADESFFVGTREGFVRLAASLLRAAASDASSTSKLIDDLTVSWSTKTHGTHFSLADIAVSAECIVSSEADIPRVVQHFA